MLAGTATISEVVESKKLEELGKECPPKSKYVLSYVSSLLFVINLKRKQDLLIFKVKLFREKDRKRERKFRLTN